MAITETSKDTTALKSPLTPSIGAGTQVKQPVVSGLFNAPQNTEAYNTLQALGRFRSNLGQAGNALMERRTQALRVGTIDDRTTKFLVAAEQADAELKKGMLRGDIKLENYYEAYEAKFKQITEETYEGLLDENNNPKDAATFLGISKIVDSYKAKKVPEVLGFGVRAENEGLKSKWHNNIQAQLRAKQDGIFSLAGMNQVFEDAMEKGMAYVKTGVFGDEKEVRDYVEGYAKDFMESELLDAATPEELKAVMNSQEFKWIDRKKVKTRINDIKTLERLEKEENWKQYKRDLELAKTRRDEAKQGVFGELYMRRKNGEHYKSLIPDLQQSLNSGAITNGEYKTIVESTPYGQEHDKRLLTSALTAAGTDKTLSKLSRDIANEGNHYTDKQVEGFKREYADRQAEIYTNMKNWLAYYKQMQRDGGVPRTSDMTRDLQQLGIENPREMVRQLTVPNPRDNRRDKLGGYLEAEDRYQNILGDAQSVLGSDPEGKQWLNSHKNGKSLYSSDNDEDMKSDPSTTGPNRENPIIQPNELREQYEAEKESDSEWAAARDEVDEAIAKLPEVEVSPGTRMEAIEKLYKEKQAAMIKGSRHDVGGGATVFEEENKVEPTVTPDAETAVKAAMAGEEPDELTEDMAMNESSVNDPAEIARQRKRYTQDKAKTPDIQDKAKTPRVVPAIQGEVGLEQVQQRIGSILDRLAGQGADKREVPGRKLPELTNYEIGGAMDPTESHSAEPILGRPRAMAEVKETEIARKVDLIITEGKKANTPIKIDKHKGTVEFSKLHTSVAKGKAKVDGLPPAARKMEELNSQDAMRIAIVSTGKQPVGIDGKPIKITVDGKPLIPKGKKRSLKETIKRGVKMFEHRTKLIKKLEDLRTDKTLRTSKARVDKWVNKYANEFSLRGIPGTSDIVKQLIAQESAYNDEAKSEDGALGLLQILPSTAQDIVDRAPKKYGFTKEKILKDPVTNVKAGMWYLADLMDNFSNRGRYQTKNKVDAFWLAVAAYNHGAGNMYRRINEAGSYKMEAIFDYLPWETASYVEGVDSSLPQGSNLRFRP